MKPLSKLSAILAAVLCAAACVDISPIEEDIRDLQARMTTLENMCAGYNSSIETLSATLKALSEQDYVTSATEVKDGDVITGYMLVFKSGKSSFVRCGMDGKDGEDGHSPVIGVKQGSDGIWYWTVDGEWLLRNGEKVQAAGRDGKDGEDGRDGQDGVTPKLKVEGAYWWVSYDNGDTWSQICSYSGGDSTPSVFSSIDISSNDYVVLTLTAGGTIMLPRYKMFSISFSPSSTVTVEAGSSAVLNYSIVGASAKTVVKALGQDGWSAKVESSSESAGTITITASVSAVSSEIVVLVNDGDRTILSSISCTVKDGDRLFTNITVPGLYSISGDGVAEAVFTPGDDWQSSSRSMVSGVAYRVSSFRQASTVKISFTSSSLTAGASGTVNVSSIGADAVADGSFEVSIQKRSGRMIWLAGSNGRGYIIETE